MPEQPSAESPDPLEEAAVGMLLGTAVGDAVGELAFAHRDRSGLIALAASLPVLRYTDDTAMTRVLAETLAETGAVEPQRLGAAFAQTHAADPGRGYGPGPPALFDHVARTGERYTEAAQRLYGNEGSFGNGGAMRAAPVGLAYRGDAATLYEAACASAAPTHAHPLGQDGAAVQARAAALAVQARCDGCRLEPPAEVAHALASFARSETLKDKMATVARLLETEAAASAVADAVGRSVAVHESLPFAIYAFLASPEDSLASLYTAVLNGGDRDTLGAMAGALSGAYLGPAGLRKAFTNRIENRDALVAAGRRLAAAFPPG